MKATVQRGSKASQRPTPQAIQAKRSKAPRMARIRAPVERCGGLLGLWATTTVLEWTVVAGAPAVGTVAVDGAAGIVVGVEVVPVVEVELGAIVPGWAPPPGVVLAGAVAAGTLDADVVLAGAVVVDAVVPCTRAEAGTWIFRIELTRLVGVAAAAAIGLRRTQRPTTLQTICARDKSKFSARTPGSPWSTRLIIPKRTGWAW